MAKQIVAASAGGGLPEWEELKGKLLVIEPEEFEAGVTTTHGTADVVRGNLYAINAKGETVTEYEDTAIFPKALVSSLKRKIGTYVVGVLTQGEKQPGKNAPWILAEPNDKHLAAAGKFVASLASKDTSGGGAAEEFEDDDEGF